MALPLGMGAALGAAPGTDRSRLEGNNVTQTQHPCGFEDGRGDRI